MVVEAGRKVVSTDVVDQIGGRIILIKDGLLVDPAGLHIVCGGVNPSLSVPLDGLNNGQVVLVKGFDDVTGACGVIVKENSEVDSRITYIWKEV